MMEVGANIAGRMTRCDCKCQWHARDHATKILVPKIGKASSGLREQLWHEKSNQ